MTTTAAPTTVWWDHIETYGRGSCALKRNLPFGEVHFDGSRTTVEVIEYQGGRALKKGTDEFNSWRNPGPHAYVLASAADAKQCREAAAALLQAAEIIEGAGR